MKCLMSGNAWDISTRILPYSARILTKQKGLCGGKYLLKTPGSAISETLNFKCPFKISQELVPLVQVPKPPTIHYQLAT